MSRTGRLGLAGGVGLLLALAGAPAAATILSFDWTRDSGVVVPTVSPSDLPEDYGDFVSGPSMAVPGGVFSYGEAGEGFTPDVALDIRAGGATPTDPNVALWALSFGDLENVVFADPASGFMEVTLTANAGFEVALHGFDLAGYPSADWVINGITISSPTATLFSQSSVLVEGGAGTVRHTEFSFASPLVASQLVIRIDYANLTPSRQDNIGLDNLRFGQTPPRVPEPGSAVQALGALLAVALLQRRKSRPPSTVMLVPLT